MAKKRRAVRRFSRRRGVMHKAKPSIALLAGAAVGPALVAFGASGTGPIWQEPSETMGREAIDRLAIVYTGYKPSDGAHFSFGQYGAYQGTAGLIAGFAGHWLASKVGLNASLARMKMPFRI